LKERLLLIADFQVLTKVKLRMGHKTLSLVVLFLALRKKAVLTSPIMLDDWSWSHYIHSKCWKPLIHRHSIASQKSSVLSFIKFLRYLLFHVGLCKAQHYYDDSFVEQERNANSVHRNWWRICHLSSKE